MKLCVFDFDSTLMDGETIDILAKELGIEDKISKITKETMQGNIDFYESLTKRVRYLKGLKEKQVDEICHNLPLMPGAKETISELKKRGHKVVIFSGGFRNATAWAKDILDFDADFSNILHTSHGYLSGNIGGDMMFGSSKGDMLQKLQKLLNIDRTDTMVVGDGANDLSMFKFADIRVAFCAKDILKKEANVVIDKKNLTEILKDNRCM
ncbi:MAG: phosphoserine phosphatase SerB [Epsilonproteobacteria bacterium]|nr:phosphoserine phosphatase SerB [Campylobacterota bacterium]